MMNEFDVRQFNIMIQKIHAFNTGHLYLSDLINDLNALVSILKDQDQDWKVLFKSYWWDLEQVYAFALEGNKSCLDSEDHQIVNEAIENLKKMIEFKLHS